MTTLQLNKIKMDFKERFKYFVENNFCSNNSQISRYLNGSNFPSTDMLAKFYSAGMSIDWLLSGNGTMFVDNPEGRKLRFKFSS